MTKPKETDMNLSTEPNIASRVTHGVLFLLLFIPLSFGYWIAIILRAGDNVVLGYVMLSTLLMAGLIGVAATFMGKAVLARICLILFFAPLLVSIVASTIL